MVQRLLLAISLLIAARMVTFISPLPAELRADRFLLEPRPRSPAAPTTTIPSNNESLPLREPFAAGAPFNSERYSPPFESDRFGEPDDRNPVQRWEQDQRTFTTSTAPAMPAYPSASAIAQVCEAIKPAVVTVRAGREIGSGSIVRSNGLVITNHHVVRRLRDQSLSVELQNGMQYTGQVIASDRRYDLALIQLNTPSPLPTVPLAETTDPTIGQAVCAIGSPFGQAGVITAGQVVSILPNSDLQSDVELQPGNSGGPLINAEGEMIGVNKGVARGQRGRIRERAIAAAARETPSSRHISYATSAKIARELIDQNQNSDGQHSWSQSTNPSSRAKEGLE